MKTVDLLTEEGKRLSGQPWQTYPRPQMRRDSFFNLNGLWEFCTSAAENFPDAYDRQIRVPFAPQSVLSGIHEAPDPEKYLFYRKSFPRPEGFGRGRVLLHFGAVDQCAQVRLNGVDLGSHTGGYTHFTFDVTELLARENVLEVRACDRLDQRLPYGKQTHKRGGMWYTPVSGIWQTVWMECVPQTYIQSLVIKTDARSARITLPGQSLSGTVTVQTPQGERRFPLRRGQALIEPDSPRLWSPEDPYLYEFTLTAGEDQVRSYFALRTLQIKQEAGAPRLCLNGKPYFFHGLLDQGYWPDGLFTPAQPELYARDIQAAKALGFNTLRKHIKVEPEQFYYDCDRLGMIVFQDMVNNGAYRFWHDTALPTLGIQKRKDRNMHKDPETRSRFLQAMEDTVRQLWNHPCICYWTIFNEGWGQFDSGAAYARLRTLDDSRFIDSASGWFRGGASDVDSRHVYFKRFRLPKSDKPVVLSEFGGYACRVPGHVFNLDKNYGYGSCRTGQELEQKLTELYRRQIVPAVEKGLCAAIYTQISDVEDETNGLLTYDRAVCKVSGKAMKSLADALKYR